ncbi:MAG: PKD domain-containing protein [Flavobacteriales bacterium]|nr:PKD domain-containing protein [Flavobacteriales bacterium]MCB0757950.1 PKD domain-containing protein [Flavobacteriales bacterium]
MSLCAGHSSKWPGVLRTRIVLTVLAACFGPLLFAQEICDNGIDDDGNGLVDLNDTLACPCNLLPPPVNLISNGSFEDHTCCPGNPGYNAGNYIDCTEGWTDYQISATADYFNPCGFFPPMIPQPVPDGNAVAGIVVHTWPGGASYEFLTQCLAAPLAAGQTYELGLNLAAVRMQFGMNGTLPINFGPLQMAIYGLDTCPPLPYTMYDPVWGSPMPAQYCPTELGFTLLGTVTYNPSNAWQNLSITFEAPFNVGAIMFGPACPVPQDYNMWGSSEPYFFIDDMSLVNAEVSVTSTGHPCTNDLVLTAAPYDAPPNTYQWYLDGVAIVGQTGPVLNASALGLGGGMYAMRVIRANGSCALAQKEVTVAYPIPLATATPQSGCAPLVVQLTNQTDPAMSGTLLWDLGDGSTAASSTVMHTYTQPGSYNVRLTVTTAQGCMADSLFEDLITVHPTPVASFTADTTIGCVGTAVTFTNTSTPAGNYACTWSFGDGALGSGSTVQHAYNNPGTYNVMLQVTNAFGCMDDVLMSQLIQILPTPQPAFSINPVSGCVPLHVRFDNLTPGQDQQTALWDLGNGQSDTQLSTSTNYTTPGTYSVSLTMTNTLGCSATLTAADTIHAYGLPTVTFFVEPDTGCAPLEVQFTNTTEPGMIGTCSWLFGDGGASNNCSTGHTYINPGTYTVSLMVTSPAGCEGDTTLYHLVQVDPTPQAAFSFGPQPTDFYHPLINFEDQSSTDAVAWLWTFSQGAPASSPEQDPQTSFPGDGGGEYPVELIVTNMHGCTDTAQHIVRIDGVFSVYVPNAFTPNADGSNDVFLPMVRDDADRDYDLRVFDRWGSEVFHSDEPANGWDGRVNGAPPVTGVYVWKLRVRNGVDRLMRQYVGHITVLP